MSTTHAQLQRAIADMQQAQREALATLIRTARKRPKDAERMADEIVANWTEGALAMLSAVTLAATPTGGPAN